MNMNQFTQKSLAAIQGAQDIALEYGHQQIEQAHLLMALVQDGEGLIPQLLTNMGLTLPSFQAAVQHEVEKLPRVSGGGREADKVYVAQDVDRALKSAESAAASMKDEYISVEHILLGLLDSANSALKELFRTYNVTREKVMQALTSVRGNQRVTSDNPEETYDALKKYGTDLVERARQNKLDPVIGRDDEIRNVIRILSRKSKNNPVLIGEPGVGKTAIAEGLAQRIVKGRILHHGTLLFDANPSMVAGALRVDPEKFRSKSTKSVRSRIGNIRDFLQQDMNLPVFWTFLKEQLAGSGMVTGALMPQELEAVEALKHKKYDQWDWNFGRSPQYDMTNKRYWDGGCLEVRICVADGSIQDIVFYGDFLAVRPLDEVEAALRGCRFRREDVAWVLDRFPITAYFGGIRKEEILDTMFYITEANQ